MLTAAVVATDAKSTSYLRACIEQTGLTESVVEWAPSIEQHPQPGESIPDVVLLDLAGGTDVSLEFGAHLRRLRPSVCVIACSPLKQPDPDLLMQAIELAPDFTSAWFTLAGIHEELGARDAAVAAFRRLFEAEAEVHGVPVADAHLHELSAVDAVIDIVGVCAAVELLEVERIECAAVPVGAGTVETAHGIVPVPPPAVARLLHGVPLAGHAANGEMTTPTGASLLVTLVQRFGPVGGHDVKDPVLRRRLRLRGRRIPHRDGQPRWGGGGKCRRCVPRAPFGSGEARSEIAGSRDRENPHKIRRR